MGVESERGKGSTFWLEMPKKEGLVDKQAITTPLPIAEEPLIEQHLKAMPDSYQTPGFQILYVEDNPVSLKMVREIIETRTQHSFLAARKGSEGLELAKKHQPGLILLDIHLEGMNGYDVLNELRANQQTRNIPVVALSADAMPENIAKGKAAGFDDYLTKPTRLNALLETIQALSIAP